MRILVTGATGRVGSRLLPRLLERGDTIRILVRQPDQVEALRQQGVEVFAGDLRQPETLVAAVADVDAVVHLAAFFRGATPEEATAINRDGTLALAQEVLQAGVPRFIFSSTNLVYGPGFGRPVQESDVPHPTLPYSISKLEAEQALMNLHEKRALGLTILRLAFVYGDGDPHLAEGMRWFRNWHPQRQFHLVHHADVARAIMLTLDTSGIDGQIYNVADDHPATASELLQVNGEQVPEDAFKYPLDDLEDPFNVLVSTEKIRSALDFQPRYPTLQDAIANDAL